MMLFLAVLLTALISVGTTFLIVRRREPRPAVPDGVQESITAFGEELNQLTFDPSSAQTTEATVKDYQLALDAYEKAKTAPLAEAALTALRDGRAALIRLDARLHGRPVPIEALQLEAVHDSSAEVVPVETIMERFVSIGTGPGKAEVTIDRPEPGRPIIAELAYNGQGNFLVELIVRTSDRQEVLKHLVIATDNYRGSHRLRVEATHLAIETKNGSGRWSVRFKPMSGAVPMHGKEHYGQGDEVVAYTGGRALVTFQVRTEDDWRAAFWCASCEDESCICLPRGTWATGVGDGLQQLEVPGAGWIVVQLRSAGTWSLHAEPSEPQARRGQQPKRRKQRRRS